MVGSSIERASGRLIRASVAIFTGIVFVLLQSLFWSNVISPWMPAIAIVVILVSYFRPHNGLLIVAAIAPLGGVWSPLLATRMRGSEAIVLAFLVGVLLRGWTLHRFRSVALDRLQIAALTFGAVVATSCVWQLWGGDFQRQDLLEYLTGHYLTSFRGFGSIFSAMLLLEGLALLLVGAHCCRTHPQFGRRLVRMLVISGVAAAIFNFWFFTHELLETGTPEAWLADFLLRQRWSAHVGDVNAAGSFFAMILCVAFGMALKSRAYRGAWLVAGFTTTLALLMTASRTALVAALIVGTIGLIRAMMAHFSTISRALTISLGVLSAMTVFIAQYYFFRPSTAPLAVNIRWEFLVTTWRMLEAFPLFGVGIGQYARWSTHFSSPELIAFYPRENAHNNFAQIAGELGLVGLAGFVTVISISLWSARYGSAVYPFLMPVVAGLITFILTWFAGHPLLVAEVAYPFWVTLAIVPGTSSEIIARPHV